MKRNWIKAALLGTCAAAIATAGLAETFNIPGGDLKSALDAYTKTTGAALIVSDDLIAGAQTRGVQGALPAREALGVILKGTGFKAQRTPSGAIGIIRAPESSRIEISSDLQLAQAAPAARAAVETVTVTSSKLGGADVQSIPISITALSQEQLTATQTAGGPDLVKQVPNLTFTKTNFTGYSINIRGIGTQAISVTTDPAVAVAFNDTPFIRNHFFEQEFYDVAQVEVLRGPQGTLYGRNATAGVVNLTSAKPTDQFEAMASGELGNYHQRRFEGMVNLPIVDDRLDIRIAGEWTKRQGYSFNAITDERIDGRDLWSGRITIGFKPFEKLQTYLVWEHFSEDDNRMRTSKQLCKTDPGRNSVDGFELPSTTDITAGGAINQAYTINSATLSQGCLQTSLYSPEAFQVPNGFSLPYYTAGLFSGAIKPGVDPYANKVQSRNLRVIESTIDPIYKAKSDTAELNADYTLTPELTLSSQTGFNTDFLWSTEDYNRFNTAPGIFAATAPGATGRVLVDSQGFFCDPQLGCSNRLIAQDLSSEHAWQLSQEFRLASHFAGPLNFSVGGNYMHYETEENYYVFANPLTTEAAGSGVFILQTPWIPGVSDDHECLARRPSQGGGNNGYQNNDPNLGAGTPGNVCTYTDPNPITKLNNEGHNYFLSQNPYLLDSYAAFGEVYYNVLDDLKLTGGLRWTEDRKHFTNIPSELLAQGYGYAVTGVVDQQWDQFTGRAAVNWTPKLDFTDQTLLYGSYAHGYKAGGANPPGADLASLGGGVQGVPVHPLTFKPEFVDAFEIGTKNTLLDGALTINGSLFYYNYENYQISEIVDRTSINLNFDAHIKGAEIEAAWEPTPGLRFNFSGGWEYTALAKGSSSVDLMDRTAGHAGWVVMKPFVTQSSNCVFPESLIPALITSYSNYAQGNPSTSACGYAYLDHVDPITGLPYDPQNPRTTWNDVNPTHPTQGAGSEPGSAIPLDYLGFDPYSAPNNGAGFSKDLSGNELPNAPPFTVSFGAQYSMPLTSNWAGTLRGDYYWQDYSWSRVFNDNPYDRIRGYTNLNLALIFTNQSGWQVMLYDKNVFNETAITGTFLNSDDSGLTTNIFLTDPKLIGIRVTKNW